MKSSRKKLSPTQIEGVSVQPMAKPASRYYWMSKEWQFGPWLMFGLGGIFSVK